MKTFLLPTILASIIFANSVAAQTIILACEDRIDYPHVNGEGSSFDTEMPGSAVEQINSMAKEIGITVKLVRIPWKRALEGDLKVGAVDGVFAASYDTDRESFGVYPMKDGKIDETRRMYASAYTFYAHRDSTVSWNGKTLKGVQGPVGAPLGYSIAADLRKQGYTVVDSGDTLFNLKRLSLRGLGTVAALELSADFILGLNQELDGTIIKLSPPIVSKPYYLMLSRQFVAKAPILAERIWNAIRTVRERDSERIMRKYMP